MRWMRMMLVWPMGLCACGPATSDDEGDGDASGSGSTSAGTTSVGTSNTSSVDSESSAATTGEPMCDALLGQDGSETTLSLRNARATTIYVDQNGCGPVFSLTGPDSGDPTPWLFPDCDMPGCDALVTGDCSVSCAACQPEILRLEAGAVYSQTWPGSVFVDATAPTECTPAECEPGCHQRVQADAGAYQVAAAIYDGCPLEDPMQCECEPVDGQCSIFGEVVTIRPVAVSLAFEYPGESAPEIVVE